MATRIWWTLIVFVRSPLRMISLRPSLQTVCFRSTLRTLCRREVPAAAAEWAKPRKIRRGTPQKRKTFYERPQACLDNLQSLRSSVYRVSDSPREALPGPLSADSPNIEISQRKYRSAGQTYLFLEASNFPRRLPSAAATA